MITLQRNASVSVFLPLLEWNPVIFLKWLEDLLWFSLDLGNNFKTMIFELNFHLVGRDGSLQVVNLVNSVDTAVIPCCFLVFFLWETHEWEELGVRVCCSCEESCFCAPWIYSLLLNVLLQTVQNVWVELLTEDLIMKVEFLMHNTTFPMVVTLVESLSDRALSVFQTTYYVIDYTSTSRDVLLFKYLCHSKHCVWPIASLL